MEANYKVVTDDSNYNAEMTNAAGKLVVANFTSARCPPCQRIAPVFAAMAPKFPGAIFLSIDISKCPNAAQSNKISATPTFIFFRNKTKVDTATALELEQKVGQHYTDADEADTPKSGVPGHMDLLPCLQRKGCECLNQNSEHPYTNALTPGDSYLESDCDEQMILSLEFSAPVKVHSLRLHGPAERGPRTLRLFTNLPYGLDFDSAESNVAAQDLQLSGKELKGELIKLKYMKFQSVNRLTIFIQDNQAGDEITQLNYIQVIGSPMTATNMSDFKRVAGKAGEGGH